jgi:hypothetical protein
MTGESGPFTGSDWPSRGLYRHGFLKNRHSYFTNPSFWPRIGEMKPIVLPEKAAFGAVMAANNRRDGLEYAGTEKTWILDHARIPGCSGGGSEPGKTGLVPGSDCLPLKPDRHGFRKNRHGYFTNPEVLPRIGRTEPAAGPEKALCSAVTAGDPDINRAADQGIRRNPAFPGVSV